MIQFNLFRIHVYESAQKPLPYGEGPDARPRILGEIFASTPHAQFKRGGLWHLANSDQLSPTSFYMKIGKSVERVREVWLEDSAGFHKVRMDEAETAHVFLDISMELLAISDNPHLGSPEQVAKWFVHLLMFSPRSVELEAVLDVDPIPDPRDLIKYIHSAFRVSRIWVEIPRKNAHNHKELLFDPVQDEAKRLNAEKVRLEWIAKEIHTTSDIDQLIAEATSMGGAAGARIKDTKKTRPRNVGTSSKPILRAQTDDVSPADTPDKKRQLLDEIRDLVEAPRKSGSD